MDTQNDSTSFADIASVEAITVAHGEVFTAEKVRWIEYEEQEKDHRIVLTIRSVMRDNEKEERTRTWQIPNTTDDYLTDLRRVFRETPVV